MLQANQTATVHESEEPGFAQELLTFTLGAEEYAIDILKVQEIRGYDAVTTIANAPSFIKGVINLRGTIVPIVELRTKFGMPTIEYTMFTVIVVVVVKEKIMGLVVDAVSDVLDIDKKDIQPAPQFGAQVDVSFLNGIGKAGDKLVALLDMDRLLTDGDMTETEKIAA